MSSYDKKAPETIQAMFNSIAKDYDRTNAILSFSMHHYWNRSLVDKTLKSKPPQTYLDLCCGTGEIAFEYLKSNKSVKAFLLDFSEQMLECAKQKAQSKQIDLSGIDFIKADAQEIPLLSSTIDSATMAYGIRNIQSPLRCLKEIHRVLNPGGVVGILELTKPENPLLRFGHSLYLRTCFPILGKVLTSNKEAYRYLCNSIHTFIPPKELENLLSQAGFNKIQRHPLSGGIATIFTAQK